MSIQVAGANQSGLEYLPNPGRYSGWGKLSMSAWLFFGGAVGTSSGRILNKSNGSTGDDFSLTIRGPGFDRFMVFRLTTSSTTTFITTKTIPSFVWTHVLAAYSGADMAVYVDGVRIDSGQAKTGTVADTGNTIGLGSHPDSSLRWYRGGIAEAAIWADVDLSHANSTSKLNEIQAMVNGAPADQIRPDGLVFYVSGRHGLDEEKFDQFQNIQSGGGVTMFPPPPVKYPVRKRYFFVPAVVATTVGSQAGRMISPGMVLPAAVAY